MSERDILADLFGPDRVGPINELPRNQFCGLYDALLEAQGENEGLSSSDDTEAYEEF